MLSSYCEGNTEKDVGQCTIQDVPKDGQELNSTEHQTLSMMFDVL